MRKAYFYWGLQELPEVETLEEIEEDGLYAVAGWKTPVSVQTATDFGEEQISAQYPKTRWGWDYDINDVLTDIKGRAAFRALDKNMSYKTAYLFTPEELEGKKK